jgi:hypothetical protein
MLRKSKAVTNLNEIEIDASKQDKPRTLLDAILSNPKVEDGEGDAEKHIHSQNTKHALFKKKKLPTSTPILIPATPVKKPSDDSLRGESVFKYSANDRQMLEEAKQEKCLAEAVFGYSRKL